MRILVAVLISMFAAAVHADTARDALTEVARCAGVADASERLKCFDAVALRAKSLLAAPAPEAETRKSFLDWFGFARPPQPVTRADDFGKPPQVEPGELSQIAATVTELAKTGRGKAIFILDNGQVWRQLDSDGTEVAFAAAGKPMKVTVETGIMGSYNLTIEGRNGLIKVTRLK